MKPAHIPIMVIPQPSAQVRSGAHARNLQRIREALEHSMSASKPGEAESAAAMLEQHAEQDRQQSRMQPQLPLEVRA